MYMEVWWADLDSMRGEGGQVVAIVQQQLRQRHLRPRLTHLRPTTPAAQLDLSALLLSLNHTDQQG